MKEDATDTVQPTGQELVPQETSGVKKEPHPFAVQGNFPDAPPAAIELFEASMRALVPPEAFTQEGPISLDQSYRGTVDGVEWGVHVMVQRMTIPEGEASPLVDDDENEYSLVAHACGGRADHTGGGFVVEYGVSVAGPEKNRLEVVQLTIGESKDDFLAFLAGVPESRESEADSDLPDDLKELLAMLGPNVTIVQM